MKKLIIILLVFVASFEVGAQGERNIWYFGRNAGVDFNAGSPPATLTNGALNSNEGCATICTPSGSLLFYSDGTRVWDRNHSVMPNGNGLAGHSSATQSCIIIPKPGSTTRYYIFTVGSHDQFPGNLYAIPFSYSEIDMTLNGGMGDVLPATKNTLLFTSSTEKIVAVTHANGHYFWVIGQEMSGTYRTYLVDCNTVHAPIMSTGGPVLLSGVGYLMASPNGRKIVNALFNNAAGYYVLDFDNATGVLSNGTSLGTYAATSWIYGVTFSQDSKLLYGLNVSDGNIHQWNLDAGSTAAIISSATVVGTAVGSGAPYRGGAMQLGPDGRIYVGQYGQAFLSVINSPNIIGTGCNFQTNVVNLQSRNAVLGLPNLLQRYKDSLIHIQHCLGLHTLFSLNGRMNHADSVRWDFDDPVTGSLNTSTSLTPDHLFSAADTYHVRVVSFLPCASDTLYSTVIIDSVPVVDLGDDIAICADTVTLQSKRGYASATYNWNTGATTPSVIASQTGTYILEVTQRNCIGRDTIEVDLAAKLNVNLGNDTVICDNTALVLSSPQPPGTQYAWSTGLNSSQITVSQAGKYWLYAYRNGCDGSDTISVSVVNAPEIYAGPDSIICAATPLKIGVFVPGATYQWSNDSATPFIHVNATDDYVITVTLGPCVVKDTVTIIAMPDPALNLGVDTDICPKQVIVLNAGNEGIIYLWDDGGSLPTDTVTEPGTYWVTVTSEYHCVSSDTITFKPFAPPTIILGDDTTVCEETPLMIRPIYSINEDELLWSNGSADRQILVTEGGVYYVQAINKCGAVSDTINIRQIFCDIWIPNAFTPNGDGINDILKVLGNISRLQDFELSIYNRWGEQVFITNDKYAGWNGMYKNSDCSMDTFVYMLQYSFDGQPAFQKGNVTLIR